METYQPLSSFYFKLEIPGLGLGAEGAFQEASGLSTEPEIEEVEEGGENRFKHKLPSAAKYSNLVLKRGMIAAKSLLADWCSNTLAGDMSAAIQTKNITLTLIDEQGTAAVQWTFMNAWPVKWSISGVEGQDGYLVVEALEFSYNYFNKLQ